MNNKFSFDLPIEEISLISEGIDVQQIKSFINLLNIYLKVSCNLPALTEKYEIKLSILPLEKGILKIMGVVVKCYK